MERVDKMFVVDESATERNHDGEHYTTKCTTAKRKHNDNDTYDQPIIKIKLGEDEIDLNELRKTVKEQTVEHDRKIALGKGVHTILGEGEGKQTALSKDLQEALELYRNEDEDYDLYNNTVLYPWQEELLKHMNPTHRQVIWVVGEKTDEGKSYFQKYIKAMFGTRRVVSGINLKASSKNICQSLRKYPLATADIFLFNLGKSLKKYEEVNYELLEDLKDGDAFAEKYDSQKLKIKTPNVVMVFSNYNPKGKELATDRWQVFHIVNEELEEREGKDHVYCYDFVKKEKKENKNKNSESVGDKKLSPKELQEIEDEICLNLCWCGYHKCDRYGKFNNLLMGVDVTYLKKVDYDRDVKKKFKCEDCPFDSAEMEDVKNHFMKNHSENYMYKCWKCQEQMKTIDEMKIHYGKAHYAEKKKEEKEDWGSDSDY